MLRFRFRGLPSGILIAFGLSMALPHAASADDSAELARLSSLVQTILVGKMPRQFEERSNWGNTVKLFDGLKFEGKGLKVKVTERKKDVAHGLWKAFKVWIDDPQRDVKIQIRNMRHTPDGHMRFEMLGTVALHGNAEMKQWSNGLLLLGVSATADATVEILLDCDVALTWKLNGKIPELEARPTVVSSKLQLKEFNLRRVGRVLHGKLAHELGDELRGTVQKILRKHEADVQREANLAIAKSLQDGAIRLSPVEFFKKSIGVTAH